MIFAFYHPVNYRPVGILALYHGRWYLCGKRGIGSGTDSGEYLHAVYNRTVFCLHPVCSRKFDDCGNLSRAGGKTEGERSLYAECGLIMYPVGVDYNTGYDISGSICKIPWSNGSYSSICENIYWNDRTISVVYILSYSFETLIKTDGYPKLATIYVTSGAVLNCILDYILVMVLHKGVWGAAFATGISQAAVILLYLWHFLGSKGTIRFSKFHLMPSEIGRQIRNGMSSGITEFSSGIIIFFFNQAILKYIGEYALVSYTIISYVNTIVVMSMAGIAQGTQPLISYYYGKNESENIRSF